MPLRDLQTALLALCETSRTSEAPVRAGLGLDGCEPRVLQFRHAWEHLRDQATTGLEASQALQVARVDRALARCCEHLKAEGVCDLQALAHPRWADVRAEAVAALGALGVTTGPTVN